MNSKSNYKLYGIAIKLRKNQNETEGLREREKNIKANEIEQKLKSRSYSKMMIICCFHSAQAFQLSDLAAHICYPHIFDSRGD